MNKDIINQILNLLEKSRRILLLTHARSDADGLGAMISAYLILKELGKEVTAVTSDPTPDYLGFLPAIKIVQNSLASAKDFIITLDCTQTEVNKIKYNLEDNRVNIIISPKNGMFSEKDVSFKQGEEQYDLIMTFDTGNLEHLGPIYDQNTELFFKTPIINIDHHASNTDFGQINLVDIMASSATEVFYELLKEIEKKYGKKLITGDIATLLLAGLITDTGSFQHANTSPRSMETAAELLDLGARQQEIVKNIYKTKKLSTLKLWGIVLSKVQVDPIHRIVWSAISQEDLKEAGAISEETGTIIDDLLSNAPGAEIIFLVKQQEDGLITVSMRSTSNHIDVGKLCGEMGGGGHVRAAGFKVKNGRPFEVVVSDVIKKVREFQASRLNLHYQENGSVVQQTQPLVKTNNKAPLPGGEKKNGKEVVLNFPQPGSPARSEPKPAAPFAFNGNGQNGQKVTAPRIEAPQQKPQEEGGPPAGRAGKTTRKRKRRRKKRGENEQGSLAGRTSNTPLMPAPARPIPPKVLTPPAPPAPRVIPAVAVVPATPPVAPAVPAILPVTPAPIVVAPLPPSTVVSVPTPPPLVPTPAPPPAPTPPPVMTSPPVAPPAPTPAPTPTSPPAPTPPKIDTSPDVPDWLKAE